MEGHTLNRCGWVPVELETGWGSREENSNTKEVYKQWLETKRKTDQRIVTSDKNSQIIMK